VRMTDRRFQLSRWFSNRTIRPAACFLAAAALAVSLSLGAGESAFIRERYLKTEHQIPMRDGVRLFTTVYSPKDRYRSYPIILMRTPYSVAPYGPNEFPDAPGRQRTRFFREGYIVVYQDVRGRYMSEGEFADVRPYIPHKNGPADIDETTDTYDTVDWLVRNVPNNNGRVGISGISYPGFYTSMGIIDAHPAVVAASPQAPVSKWMGGDDFFHNGAFLLSHAFDFFSTFGQPRPKPRSSPDPRFDHKTGDGYSFFLQMGPLPNANARYLNNRVAFWNAMMQHGTWDAFWEARNILPHLKNIRPAVLVVGGWFDAENLFGALHTHEAIVRQDPGARCTLVMGPWSHGQWNQSDGRTLGAIDFGSKTSDYYIETIEGPFFDYHLKGRGTLNLPGAIVFETGANRWLSLPEWPPEDLPERNLYLQDDGGLSWHPPSNSSSGYREYVSDPAKPVPYTSEKRHWYDPAFMVEDQRFAATRSDVLVYQTPPLESGVTVAGPLKASLFVSTSGTDSDWIVKVIDVLPGSASKAGGSAGDARLAGYQMLVRGDVMRGKFRNSLSKPEAFVPGEVTRVEFVLQDVFHTFLQGHRIMVQIQSTWFPMIDLNPQKFVDIYRARASDFQTATQRVYSSGQYPSEISFGVMR
jgi:hypothetical protein